MMKDGDINCLTIFISKKNFFLAEFVIEEERTTRKKKGMIIDHCILDASPLYE